MIESHRAIERVARESYGRLVAFLAAKSHDLAGAEDALGDAFAQALEYWPTRGMPENPEAWLLTAARRKLIDQSRRLRIRQSALSEIPSNLGKASCFHETSEAFPDERIKLFFVCAHPAIDPAIRTPLMLQTVLGLNAATIASAFLVPPSTMGQRLVRAKAKIQHARISFRIPEADELPQRLEAVLETIYAAFGLGWDRVGDAATAPGQLTDEAIWLARIIIKLIPESAEAYGLLSLMLFCESRRHARRDAQGNYVPLSNQDTTLWSHSMIDEAEQFLFKAVALKKIGHFQIEAAIQSAHAERHFTGITNWKGIARLYDILIAHSPTLGAAIGQAAAVAEAQCPENGLAILTQIDESALASYQPYWALKAHLLCRLKRYQEARDARFRAIGLTEDESQRRFLQSQLPESENEDQSGRSITKLGTPGEQKRRKSKTVATLGIRKP